MRQERATTSTFILTSSHSNPSLLDGSYEGLKFPRKSRSLEITDESPRKQLQELLLEGPRPRDGNSKESTWSTLFPTCSCASPLFPTCSCVFLRVPTCSHFFRFSFISDFLGRLQPSKTTIQKTLGTFQGWGIRRVPGRVLGGY